MALLCKSCYASSLDRGVALKGGLGLIPDDPSRIAPYDLRQSYMSLSWPWVRLLRVLAVSSFARRLHAAAHQSNPAPVLGRDGAPRWQGCEF